MARTLDDPLTDQERGLLGMLRLQGEACRLKITIAAEPGHWDITLEDRESGDPPADGHGPDFDSAWSDIVDPRLRAWSEARDATKN
jgi:hypothetical protein